MADKCICKICNCGKHKCCISRKCEQWDPNVGSEYGKQFVAHSTCREPSYKPPANTVKNAEPLQSMTTNRKDYVEHQMPVSQKPVRPNYKSPTEPMQTTSIYRNAFVEMPTCASKPIKPVSQRLDSGPFNSTTSNRTDYVPHEMQRVESYKPENPGLNNAPFDGATSNRTDYVPHKIQFQRSYKPPSVNSKSAEPFTGISENKSQFIEHALKPHDRYQQPKYTKPNGDMDLKSTYNTQYQPHGYCAPTSCRPPYSAVKQEPFIDNTMYRSEYVTKTVLPCPAQNLPISDNVCNAHGQFQCTRVDDDGHKYFSHKEECDKSMFPDKYN